MLSLTDDFCDLAADSIEVDIKALEASGGHAFAFMNESKQDVLGTDVVVVEMASFFLGQHDHTTSSIGEAFEHTNASIAMATLDGVAF